jgi:surface antigen
VGGGSHYRRHHGHRHDGDAGVALGAGLIFGMLLGSAIENSYERRYREPAYYGPPPGYRPAPRVVYDEPSVTIAQRPAGACLQEREYQTKVVVNGRKVDAYGIACLQPDGSWHQGPAQLVPEF